LKPRRLSVLLAVMLALLALRWWSPPVGSAPLDVAAAVARPVAATASAAAGVTASADLSPIPEDLAAGTRDLDPPDLRNAFAVRVAPAPSAPPAPPQQQQPRAFVGPPMPPPAAPPPPPPFKVIGSWRDEQGASVFLAGPSGVVQGHIGDLLAAEYRVLEITPQKVLLKHLPSNGNVSLAVPSGTGSSLLTTTK